MKKTLSQEAQVKEAAFWGIVRQLMMQNPGKVCHK
jgi:siderophore synthetase component